MGRAYKRALAKCHPDKARVRVRDGSRVRVRVRVRVKVTEQINTWRVYAGGVYAMHLP